MNNTDFLNASKTLSEHDEKVLESLSDMQTLVLTAKGVGCVDRYELIEKLGQGGFGAVYGARDTEAEILVAIKALPAEVSCDAAEMMTIRKNFSLVFRLRHPNIASVLHLHRVENPDARATEKMGIKAGDYLVVMEYAPGATLSAFRAAMPKGKMTLAQALEYTRPIAQALDYAHSQKVIHRDIKPGNIVVNVDERTLDEKDLDGRSLSVKVLDFGLAAEIRSSMIRKTKDQKDLKCGTPNYMAPEQWRGKPQDGRADQYALAALIYELVNGEVAFKSVFDSGNIEIMRSVVLNEPVDHIPEITKKQNAILLRAMSKDPEKRFSSCDEFFANLADIKPPKPKSTGWKVLLLLMVLAVSGYYSYRFYLSYNIHSAKIQKVAQEAKTILKEAQLAFKAGDLDISTEKVRKALQLLPEKPETLALVAEIEDTVDSLKTKAENASKNIAKEITERGQDAEEFFQTLEKQRRIAQDAYREKNWGTAFNALKQVIETCDTIRTYEASRNGAKNQKRETDNHRKNAERISANSIATEEWEKAEKLASAAANAYEKNQFDEASKCWKTAAELFQTSEHLARTTPFYQKAKEEWENRTVGNGQEILDEDLMKHAATLFEAAQQSAQQGEASQKDPALGKTYYESALASYKKAAEKTIPLLIPQMKWNATLDGKDVAATLQVGKQTITLPGTIKLEKSKTYETYLTYFGCKPISSTLTADWNGLKETCAVLEKMKRPTAGNKWTAKLGAKTEKVFLPIPTGSFLMGSNDGADDEKPVRTVQINNPFWMAETEVTQGEFKKFISETSYKTQAEKQGWAWVYEGAWKKGKGKNWSNLFVGKDRPVTCVSWDDAIEFCAWLTQKEHAAERIPKEFEYALPTEAQWEYACRAGTKEKYAGELESMAWYSENSGSETHSVGTKKANGWGLYDMHGNVWEWCLDDWARSYEGASTDGTRRGDGTGFFRVYRGGGWGHNASSCRSSKRSLNSPIHTYNYLGFRPVVQQKMSNVEK